MGDNVPQSVRKLLKVLERIEKAFPTKKEHEGPKANTNGGGSSKKKMVTFSDPIPKKSRRDAKHFVLWNTHNTGECLKYEKDRTPRKAFIGKSAQRNPCSRNVPCRHNTSYTQLSVKIAKLEKSNKELKRLNKKCKHDRNSDSDDSDSSWMGPVTRGI